jgi:hypothetical protein
MKYSVGRGDSQRTEDRYRQTQTPDNDPVTIYLGSIFIILAVAQASNFFRRSNPAIQASSCSKITSSPGARDPSLGCVR